MNKTGRVFVVVQGGYVTTVDVPGEGMHTVIDCDEAENDPADVWARFDPVDREYVMRECPELFDLYFRAVAT